MHTLVHIERKNTPKKRCKKTWRKRRRCRIGRLLHVVRIMSTCWSFSARCANGIQSEPPSLPPFRYVYFALFKCETSQTQKSCRSPQDWCYYVSDLDHQALFRCDFASTFRAHGFYHFRTSTAEVHSVCSLFVLWLWQIHSKCTPNVRIATLLNNNGKCTEPDGIVILMAGVSAAVVSFGTYRVEKRAIEIRLK